MNQKHSTGHFRHHSDYNSNNKGEAALRPSSRLRPYELSMLRVAHLSGGAGGGERRPVKYAANIMQLSCTEALGFNSLHEVAF